MSGFGGSFDTAAATSSDRGFRPQVTEQAGMNGLFTRRQALAGSCASLFGGVRISDRWLAGTARARITPDGALWQAGYAARTRASEGTLEEIYARALALDDGSGEPAVLVSSDLLGLPRNVAQGIASQAESRYGIPRDRLVLNSSHTHGGPVVGNTLRIAYHATPEQWEDIYRYTGRLETEVVECIGDALRDIRPARAAFGRTRTGFAANRRSQGGPVDHDVPILKIEDLAGRPRAIVFTYACHNTTLGGDEYRFHGDYAGYAQDYLEARNPGAVAMYVAGCGGDANPAPRGRLADVIGHGEALGKAVQDGLSSAGTPLTGPLATAFETTTLRFAPPPSREELQKRLQDKDIYVQRHGRMMLDILDRHGRIPTEYPYPVQAWRFGDQLTMLLLGGEVVVDYALRLKKELDPDRTWVAAYSNDVPFYVPSVRVLKEGGYEGGGAMIYYGQPGPFADSVEETIIRKAHQLARRVS